MRSILEGMLSDIGGEGLFNGILEILMRSPFSYGTAAKAVSSIYEIVMSVAMMLIVVYFLIALVDKMTSENFTWEQLWKQLAMFLAAKFMIEHGLDIMKIMSQIGVELVHWIGMDRGMLEVSDGEYVVKSALEFSGGLDADAIITDFENQFSGIFKVIGHIVLFGYIIFPWILSWIMGMAVKIICYTRLVEIYIRACFAPVALSDFFKNGFQGGGWRFLMNFLAVCLQGSVLLVIAVLFSALLEQFLTLSGADSTNWFQFMGIYAAVGCSSIMLMFRSLGLCKELLGVN